MRADLDVKKAALDARMEELGRVVVAFSGGVDSALVAATAHRVLGERSFAVTAVSPSLAAHERRAAAELARRNGWAHAEIDTHEVDRPDYARNAPDRCFWCKTELFEMLTPIAAERKASLVVGTNADDLHDHRPGHRAARERGVVAPLAEIGMTKVEVRRVAAALGLPVADKPASPCLASRVAYGVPVTRERLGRIEAAEAVLRELGFDVLRVRDHGELARIEVPPEEIHRVADLHAHISQRFSELGFRYVTLDLSGFRSGSLNEVLAPPAITRRST